MSQSSHAQFPLRRHPRLLVDHRRAESASVADSRGADAERLTGSGGRLHFGMVAGFKSESVAGLRRNSQPTSMFSALALRLLRKLGENRGGIGNVCWSRERYGSHCTASEPELAPTKQA